MNHATALAVIWGPIVAALGLLAYGVRRSWYAIARQPYVIWREGEPSTARVYFGGIRAMWGEFWTGIPAARVNVAPVTELTLAGIMPMSIAIAWEEMTAAWKRDHA